MEGFLIFGGGGGIGDDAAAGDLALQVAVADSEGVDQDAGVQVRGEDGMRTGFSP